jgi:putative endonuclease
VSRLLWHTLDGVRRSKQTHALSSDAALGRYGEDLAHRFLERAGLAVIARNYRPRGGEAEVDLVARDGDLLVFVEVKTRTTAEYGSPDRAIGTEKQRNIVRAARAFAQRAEIPWSAVRFDTVSVLMTDPPAIEHTKDAFFIGRAH